MKISAALRKDLLFIAVLTVFSAAMWCVPDISRLSDGGGERVVGKVVEVDNSQIEKHGLVLYGSQNIKVDIDGRIFRANNQLRAQMELDKIFKAGDRVIVIVNPGDTPENTVLIAQDHYRNFWIFALFAGFCILLCWFGAWTGVKALLSFVFSCLAVWKIIIPLILHGFHASWMIFGVVCLLTAVIIFLVAGFTRKALAAFAGAISGIFAGLLMAHVFGILMHINGAVLPCSQALLYSGYEYLNIRDLFIGAMILASSGAVMDLAMDIASGVEEVVRHNPGLSRRELVMSGMRIGRSVVGTMTTTLLLAYSGGYITLLMMFAAQGVPVSGFINNPLVASEIAKTLIGSFSLVLVAPFTALASGWIFGRRS